VDDSCIGATGREGHHFHQITGFPAATPCISTKKDSHCCASLFWCLKILMDGRFIWLRVNYKTDPVVVDEDGSMPGHD
jgi:hypothetical protein